MRLFVSGLHISYDTAFPRPPELPAYLVAHIRNMTPGVEHFYPFMRKDISAAFNRRGTRYP